MSYVLRASSNGLLVCFGLFMRHRPARTCGLDKLSGPAKAWDARTSSGLPGRAAAVGSLCRAYQEFAFIKTGVTKALSSGSRKRLMVIKIGFRT